MDVDWKQGVEIINFLKLGFPGKMLAINSGPHVISWQERRGQCGQLEVMNLCPDLSLGSN
jgi:hypothetical protein